jgi:hypothetical protein
VNSWVEDPLRMICPLMNEDEWLQDTIVPAVIQEPDTQKIFSDPWPLLALFFALSGEGRLSRQGRWGKLITGAQASRTARGRLNEGGA